MATEAKTVVVTGASQGIGAGVAKAFLDRGYRVVANSRRITQSSAFSASDRLALVDGDVGDPQTAAKIAETAVGRFGSIDALVNNAGIFFTKRFTDYTAEDFHSLVSTNLEGFLYITQLAIRRMLSQKTGGSIVTITASLADNPIAGVTAAVPMITKGGLNAVTHQLAMEYAREGIRVNAVAPGVVATPLHKNTPDEVMKGLSPMGRVSTVKEIADAVLYLTEALTVTGEVLHVDGGGAPWQVVIVQAGEPDARSKGATSTGRRQMSVKAWVATAAKQKMVLQDIDLGPLGAEDVEVAVEHCGLCHSDVSVLNDEWGMSQYPAVLGHEVVGRVAAVGLATKGVKVGQRVGIGWTAASCMHCRQCLSGDQHLCLQAVPMILGHRGGFASRARCHWAWAVPLPEGLNYAEAGPLLCGGVTVFHPLDLYAKPTSRVGIVGIGGLGHMAVKFADAYGCDVTAFTSSESKFEEARGFGAKHVVSSRDSAAIKKLAGTIDLLIVTVNVPLDWNAMIGTLAPNGRMHVVGAVLEPIPVAVTPLIFGQRSISGSPTGSPVDIATMLEYAARRGVAPQTEHFPMSRINDAFQRLEAGKARYRIVLDADF